MTHHLSPIRTCRPAGFSLVEIVIVLVIISILLGTAINMMSRSGDDAKMIRVDADVQAISTCLQRYEALAGRMPTSEQGIAALVEKPTSDPVPERWTMYLKDMPTDPWKQPYKYVFPAVKSKDPFDLWSVGPDGQDGTADDIGNFKSTPAK